MVVTGSAYSHPVSDALIRRVCATAVTVTPPQSNTNTPAPSSPPLLLSVRAPGSKSVSNRALLLAGLSRGTTRISGLLASDDTQVMLAALSAIGASVAWEQQQSGGSAPIVVVTGTGGRFSRPQKPIYVGNAGTASRFLTSVLCLLPPPPAHATSSTASSGGGDGAASIVLCGNARMSVRPIGPLVDALREQGAVIEYTGANAGCPPLRISSGVSGARDSRGPTAAAAAPATAAPATAAPSHRVVRLAGKLSSQYVSSILMAAPYFPPLSTTCSGSSSSGGNTATTAPPSFTELLLEEEVPTSLPYIVMTLSVMAQFGIHVTRLADNRYHVPCACYTSPGSSDVEADASSASYAAALGALGVGAAASGVVLEGVGSQSTQGDAGFPALLARMGAQCEQSAHSTIVRPPPGGRSALHGIDVDMANTTDCFMTLAAVAAVAVGVTRITGIGNQRVKECNRIAAMVAELGKVGVAASELPDGIQIEGRGGEAPSGSTALTSAQQQQRVIHCYDDHRIAMSFSVLGSVLPGGLTCDDAPCTEKTYPEWWDVLGSAFGVEVAAATVSTAEAAAAAAVAAAPVASISSSSAATVAASPSQQQPLQHPLPHRLSHSSLALSAPVILIGMRGVGKSSLGAFAASWLGASSPTGTWRCVDLDRELEAAAGGRSCSRVVEDEGWAAFRAREVDALAKALQGSSSSSSSSGGIWSVVVCGGGGVETPAFRDLLSAHRARGALVIEIRRDIANIEEDIALSISAGSDAGRPAYAAGATLADTSARRRPLFESASSHCFAIAKNDRDWGLIAAEFGHWVARLLGRGLGVIADETVAMLGARSDASAAAATTIAPAVVVADGGASPSLESPSSSPSAPGALAALPRVPTASFLSGRAQREGVVGSAFVCLALPDLRELVAPTAAATSSSSSSSANGVTTSADADAAAAAEMPSRRRLWELARRLHTVLLGADAVELRVDCLTAAAAAAASAHNAADGVLFQLALLRRLLTLAALPGAAVHATTEDAPLPDTTGGLPLAPLPVIYTVRSDAEGGNFDTTEDASAATSASSRYSSLVLLGVRAGVHVVDVEVGRARWPVATIDAIAAAAAHAHTGVIASCHGPKSPPPNAQEVRAALGHCARLGPSAIVKLVAAAESTADAVAFRTCALGLARELRVDHARLIVIAMGSAGAVTRVLNDSLTPVTHRDLQRKSAPGQLSVEEVRALRESLGIAPRGHCYLFGSPIAASVSPVIHAAAFRATHVPITYGLHETAAAASIDALLRDASAHCVGGNVTIPLKQDALGVVDSVSDVVACIGAVNTLIVSRVPRFSVHAENTDWIGMYGPLREKLCRHTARGDRRVLILGAGGTAMAACFVAAALGCAPAVFNRTHAKAEALVSRFGGTAVSSISADFSCCAVINTLPGSVETPQLAELLRRCVPVVFDVTYKPYWTKVLTEAAAAGCPTIHGIEMLCVQGFAGESMWTGRYACPISGCEFGGVELAEIRLLEISAQKG